MPLHTEKVSYGSHILTLRNETSRNLVGSREQLRQKCVQKLANIKVLIEERYPQNLVEKNTLALPTEFELISSQQKSFFVSEKKKPKIISLGGLPPAVTAINSRLQSLISSETGQLKVEITLETLKKQLSEIAAVIDVYLLDLKRSASGQSGILEKDIQFWTTLRVQIVELSASIPQTDLQTYFAELKETAVNSEVLKLILKKFTDGLAGLTLTEVKRKKAIAATALMGTDWNLVNQLQNFSTAESEFLPQFEQIACNLIDKALVEKVDSKQKIIVILSLIQSVLISSKIKSGSDLYKPGVCPELSSRLISLLNHPISSPEVLEPLGYCLHLVELGERDLVQVLKTFANLRVKESGISFNLLNFYERLRSLYPDCGFFAEQKEINLKIEAILKQARQEGIFQGLMAYLSGGTHRFVSNGQKFEVVREDELDKLAKIAEIAKNLKELTAQLIVLPGLLESSLLKNSKIGLEIEGPFIPGQSNLMSAPLDLPTPPEIFVLGADGNGLIFELRTNRGDREEASPGASLAEYLEHFPNLFLYVQAVLSSQNKINSLHISFNTGDKLGAVHYNVLKLWEGEQNRRGNLTWQSRGHALTGFTSPEYLIHFLYFMTSIRGRHTEEETLAALKGNLTPILMRTNPALGLYLQVNNSNFYNHLVADFFDNSHLESFDEDVLEKILSDLPKHGLSFKNPNVRIDVLLTQMAEKKGYDWLADRLENSDFLVNQSRSRVRLLELLINNYSAAFVIKLLCRPGACQSEDLPYLMRLLVSIADRGELDAVLDLLEGSELLKTPNDLYKFSSLIAYINTPQVASRVINILVKQNLIAQIIEEKAPHVSGNGIGILSRCVAYGQASKIMSTLELLDPALFLKDENTQKMLAAVLLVATSQEEYSRALKLLETPGLLTSQNVQIYAELVSQIVDTTNAHQIWVLALKLEYFSPNRLMEFDICRVLGKLYLCGCKLEVENLLLSMTFESAGDQSVIVNNFGALAEIENSAVEIWDLVINKLGWVNPEIYRFVGGHKFLGKMAALGLATGVVEFIDKEKPAEFQSTYSYIELLLYLAENAMSEKSMQILESCQTFDYTLLPDILGLLTTLVKLGHSQRVAVFLQQQRLFSSELPGPELTRLTSELFQELINNGQFSAVFKYLQTVDIGHGGHRCILEICEDIFEVSARNNLQDFLMSVLEREQLFTSKDFNHFTLLSNLAQSGQADRVAILIEKERLIDDKNLLEPQVLWLLSILIRFNKGPVILRLFYIPGMLDAEKIPELNVFFTSLIDAGYSADVVNLYNIPGVLDEESINNLDVRLQLNILVQFGQAQQVMTILERTDLRTIISLEYSTAIFVHLAKAGLAERVANLVFPLIIQNPQLTVQNPHVFVLMSSLFKLGQAEEVEQILNLPNLPPKDEWLAKALKSISENVRIITDVEGFFRFLEHLQVLSPEKFDSYEVRTLIEELLDHGHTEEVVGLMERYDAINLENIENYAYLFEMMAISQKGDIALAFLLRKKLIVSTNLVILQNFLIEIAENPLLGNTILDLLQLPGNITEDNFETVMLLLAKYSEHNHYLEKIATIVSGINCFNKDNITNIGLLIVLNSMCQSYMDTDVLNVLEQEGLVTSVSLNSLIPVFRLLCFGPEVGRVTSILLRSDIILTEEADYSQIVDLFTVIYNHNTEQTDAVFKFLEKKGILNAENIYFFADFILMLLRNGHADKVMHLLESWEWLSKDNYGQECLIKIMTELSLTAMADQLGIFTSALTSRSLG